MAIGLALAMLLAGAPAAAAAPPGTPPPVTRPKWIRKPAGLDMAEVYPVQATQADLDGEAVIDCEVSAEGTLSGCRIINEEPQAQGFGDAALKLAAIFKMERTDASGAPTPGRRIRLPIVFMLPGASITKPLPIPSESLAGGQFDLDCRSRGAVLDNCLLMDAKPATADLLAMADQIKGKLLHAKNAYPDGRVVVRFQFVQPRR